MNRPTWEDLIADADKGYGELEIIMENGRMRCGPISNIRRGEDNMIQIDVIWMASQFVGDTKWLSDNTNHVLVSSECRLENGPEGVIRFKVPNVGSFVITKKNTTHVDVTEVEGLEWDQIQRFRAWEYGLNLEATWDEIVYRVVNDLGGSGLTDYDEQMRVQDERERAMKAAA